MLGKELLKKTLYNIIDAIDCGNSDYTDDECVEILESINKITNTRNKISKYQACKILNISRATFDNYVNKGIIPEAQKEVGFKEKFWDLKQIKDVKLKLRR